MTVLTLLLFLFHVSDSAAASRGLRVETKGGADLYLYKDYHALVVGVGDYTNGWPDLPGAVKDAKEVAAALEKYGFSVTLLLDPDAGALKRALGDLAFRTGTEKDRALMLFFAGHGETLTLADGTKLGYIVPTDAPLKSADPMGFDDVAISMKEIESLALKAGSKHFLLVFDSCFSGSIFSLSRAAPTDISEKSARPVRQFITAGGAGETVPDRSMFKIVFLDGIAGEADFNRDGYVTGSELGMHLQDRVVNYTRGAQHPQYGKINNPKLDKGDFIFALASGGAYSPEPPPKPPAEQDELEQALAKIRAQKAAEQQEKASREKKFRRFAEDIEKYREIEQAGAAKPTRLAAWRAFERKYPEWSSGVEPGDTASLVRRALEADNEGILLAMGVSPGGGPKIRNAMGMEFVYIPPGAFTMGSPESEPGRDSDERQHQVTLTKGFYMMTTEVTQGQWKQVMGSNPSHFKSCGDDCPVESVSWYEVQQFIEKLNRMEGTGVYRLPTEGEWEYAARAGSTTAFFWGNQADCSKMMYENDVGSSEDKCVGTHRSKGLTPDSPAPVKKFLPNDWGLYDMHGNVWEWCQDWYGDYPAGAVTDPTGPSTGSHRVYRGGSWYRHASGCRSAERSRDVPGYWSSVVGFRLSRNK